MIQLFIGKLGSGKSLDATRRVLSDKSGLITYTNMDIDSPNAKKITFEDIISGTGKESKINWDYWNAQKKPLNVMLDEAGLIAGSRESMSKANRLINSFVCLARRVCSMDSRGYGKMGFITQHDLSD